MIKRMWVNQPSKLHPLAILHGTNVLAVAENSGWRIYFLCGDIISQLAPKNSLSEGWL